jgi:hypothetical protein
VLQLDLGGLAIVAGQQRQVQMMVLVERFEQLLRARHQPFVSGAGVLNLLGQERDVGLTKTIVLLDRVGHSRLCSAFDTR